MHEPLGGGYLYTRYDSVPDGADESEGTAALLFGTNFKWEVTEKIDFEVQYTGTMAVPDTQQNNHHLLAMISVEIWNDFDLDVSFVWDRVGDPRPDSDGNVPDKDDYRLQVGLGWEF